LEASVAIISNGNTVKNTEYSFLANVLAARGYLVASIQQDLPSDPPLITKVGLPYVGRRGVYERGEANILFVLGQLKKLQPNADYRHLTLVGHSNGGDVAMYCAKQHPELVSKVITLDNLRVPFVLSDKLKILSFRSKDPNFKTDPGVLSPGCGFAIATTPFFVRTRWSVKGSGRFRGHQYAKESEATWPEPVARTPYAGAAA
jgi:pimeloyl-ACP methyl ester carboxylesterase